MPCSFVHGTGDPRTSENVAHLAGAVPRAELHVIDGAGHEPWCDRPDELRVLLGRLISAGA